MGQNDLLDALVADVYHSGRTLGDAAVPPLSAHGQLILRHALLAKLGTLTQAPAASNVIVFEGRPDRSPALPFDGCVIPMRKRRPRLD